MNTHSHNSKPCTCSLPVNYFSIDVLILFIWTFVSEIKTDDDNDDEDWKGWLIDISKPVPSYKEWFPTMILALSLFTRAATFHYNVNRSFVLLPM